MIRMRCIAPCDGSLPCVWQEDPNGPGMAFFRLNEYPKCRLWQAGTKEGAD